MKPKTKATPAKKPQAQPAQVGNRQFEMRFLQYASQRLGVSITPSVVNRLMARVNFMGPMPDQSISHYRGLDECWTWEGPVKSTGYGSLRISKKLISAHRASFVIAGNELHYGQCVLHLCDNRRCVNPAHLRAGSIADNVRDMIDKGRINPASGDRNGSVVHRESMRRGESVNTAKLSANDVLHIRKIMRTQTRGVRALAKTFQVSEHSIRNVITRATWKHI